MAFSRRATRVDHRRSLLEKLESRVLLTVTSVPANGDLQSYINAAQPGDTLVLPTNGVYVGNFTLPNKVGNATITIRSAALASLPAGVRVGPAQASLMPKILTGVNGVAALATKPGAHDYSFQGIEFSMNAPTVTVSELISLGTAGAAQDTLAEVPTRLSLDRCYIHGAPNNVSLKRGIGLNSSYTDITNSYIADWHSNSQDSQAIGGYNGPGNYNILNNYIEGAGENILFGGADATIANLVPSNIVVRGNLFSKPLTWNHNDPSTYAGTYYVVKNIFELKSASNVTVERNVFENNWAGGQSGFAIVFTPRNQDGQNPWNTISNVTFTNNIVRHSGGGFNILSSDDGNTSQTLHDVTISNNLLYDIGGSQWGNNYVFQILRGKSAGSNLSIEHNTAWARKGFMAVDSGGTVNPIFSNFIFRNNITTRGTYGLHGSNGEGTKPLDAWFSKPSDPNFIKYTFTNNVLTGAPSNSYPAGNFFPANDAAVGFIDIANDKYGLATTSPYKGKASDGTDPGINYPSVVSINRAGSSPTNAGTVNFTVTFSKGVSGVDPSDFVLATSGVSGASIISVTPTAVSSVWTVTVNTGTGDGTLGLNLVDDDSILSTAGGTPLGFLGVGNGNFTGQVYALDRTAPLVALLSPGDGELINGTTALITGNAGQLPGDSGSVTIRIYAGATATGSPVQTLSGTVNGATGGFSISSTGLPQGQYTVQVSQTDAAGNVGTSAAVTYFTYNTLPGDANNDGTVNFADYTILSNNYGQPSDLGPAVADFNYDGVTNFADYTILSNHYGMSAPLNFTVTSSAEAGTAAVTSSHPGSTKKPKHEKKVAGVDALDHGKKRR